MATEHKCQFCGAPVQPWENCVWVDEQGRDRPYVPSHCAKDECFKAYCKERYNSLKARAEAGDEVAAEKLEDWATDVDIWGEG